MRYAIFLILVSCQREPVGEATWGMVKMEDKENGVVCYRFRAFEGISCVKIK